MEISHSLLAECGLNETEQVILLCLLQEGRSRASEIAKRTDMKRPTVYSALGNLLDIGLVATHVFRGVTFY